MENERRVDSRSVEESWDQAETTEMAVKAQPLILPKFGISEHQAPRRLNQTYQHAQHVRLGNRTSNGDFRHRPLCNGNALSLNALSLTLNNYYARPSAFLASNIVEIGDIHYPSWKQIVTDMNYKATSHVYDLIYCQHVNEVSPRHEFYSPNHAMNHWKTCILVWQH